MKIEHWNSADRAAVRVFYESGQAWSWQEIDGGATARGRRVRDWIESSPLPRQHPVVLPACRTGETESWWLAVAFSEAQTAELREQLDAFVGSAGADYQGRRAELNPADALDQSVIAWAGGPWAFRFAALPAFRDEVRAALSRMRRVWSLQPAQRAGVFRSTEALLGEFFSAIANRDEPASSAWLEVMRASGRLSAENLHFLEIERLGAFHRWDRIALHPHFSLLLAMRRPRRITALLIEALWRTELAGFAATGQADEALRYTREQFLPRYVNLLRARGMMNQPAVVLTFLLASAASIPPRREQLPVLLAALRPDTAEYGFAHAIVALAMSDVETTVVSSDPLQSARAALDNDDFDTAWTHLLDVSPSIVACKLQMDCAQELIAPGIAQTVFDSVSSLSPQDRAALVQTKRYSTIWNEIQTSLTKPQRIAPINWETWLDAVDTDPAWGGALETARDGVGEWDLDAYTNEPARVAALNARLQCTRDPIAGKVVRLALPQLLRFFLPDGIGRSEFQAIYADLLLTLAVDERFGGADWELAQTLTWAMLETGVSVVEYRTLAEALTTIWNARGDTLRLDWALDLLDALAVAPLLDPEARDSFFTSVWKTFQAHPRRVQVEQREIFRLLSSDLGRLAEFEALPVPNAAESRSGEVDFTKYLRGRIVGIYTLEESAGSRARNILESLEGAVEVRLSHDHVGSDRLRSLAREADYFVVMTRSAKHAATNFIKAERPTRLHEIIYAPGKGSSSLITALREAVLKWN